jgi:hemoglobin-like flavoprotein
MPIQVETASRGTPAVFRPSAEVMHAIAAACQHLYAIESDFLAQFHDALLQLVPALAATAADRGRSLSDGLGRAVLWAALTEDGPEVIEATFRNVGAEYCRRGFPDDGYHGVGHALLRAARDGFSGGWTSELSSTWVAFYGWLGAHLQDGARQARQSLAPAPAVVAGPLPTDVRTSPRAAAVAPSVSRPQFAGVEPQVPTPAGAPAPSRILPLAGTGPGGPSGPAGGPSTLDGVLELLRGRYFVGDEWALDAILNRVALRTGADLRAPRPDQRANPAVIANVTAVLQVMGYPVQPGSAQSAADVTPGDRQPTAWWRRAVPGMFR